VSAMRELGLRANVRSDGDRDALHQRRAGQSVSLRCELSSIMCARSTCFRSASERFLFIFNYALQPFKAYCAIWFRRSNFRHQASPRMSQRESTQRRKVELWAKNVREFCLNANFHVTFRDLLHAVELRGGTDGFSSPPKESVLRIFFAVKIRRLRPVANPRTWVPKSSTLPLDHLISSLHTSRSTSHEILLSFI
jgi:hypothetical protein